MRVRIAGSALGRLRGLLGKSESEEALLLVPCHDVHTFGMRQAIDVAFIAEDGTVIESYRDIGSRRRLRCVGACAVLERFAEEGVWFESGDRFELKKCIRESVERGGDRPSAYRVLRKRQRHSRKGDKK